MFFIFSMDFLLTIVGIIILIALFLIFPWLGVLLIIGGVYWAIKVQEASNGRGNQ